MRFLKELLYFFGYRNNPVVGTITIETAMYENMRSKLRILGHYKPNWDGETGEVFQHHVLRQVGEFIDLMELRAVPVPSLCYAGDGEISFRWQKEGSPRRAAVSFASDGSVVGYCTTDSTIIKLNQSAVRDIMLDPYLIDFLIDVTTQFIPAPPRSDTSTEV